MMIYAHSLRYKIYANLLVLSGLIALLAGYSMYYFPAMNSVFHFMPLLLLPLCRFSVLFSIRNFPYAVLYSCSWFFLFAVSSFHAERLVDVFLYVVVLWGSVFIALRDEYKQYIFDCFVRCLACVFFVSLLEYFVLQLTGFSISLGVLHRSEDFWGEYNQLLFNVSHLGTYGARFQSLAEEPGVVGTLTAFLLCTLDTKRYKKERYVFWVAGLLSFSMAFYVMMLLYYVLSVKKVFRLVAIGVCVLIFALIFQNQFQEQVFDRITGEAEFDTRTHDQFESLYEIAKARGDLWLGCGYGSHLVKLEGSGEGNAGMYPFIYEYGYIGAFVILSVFSWIFLRLNGASRESLIILVVFLASFYQRANIYISPNIIVLFAYSLQKRIN